MARLKNLYELVHCLDKVEKRALRQFVRRAGKNRVSQQELLLDVLLGTEDFDEESLKTIFASLNIVGQLSTLLMRLRKQVVHAMTALQADRSVDGRLAGLMNEIRMLIGKQLYEQGRGVLQKAEELATHWSRHEFALQLIQWKQKMLLRLSPEDLNDQLESMRVQEQRLLDSIRLRGQLKFDLNRIRFMQRKVLQAQAKEDLADLESIFQKSPVDSGRAASDFLCRVYSHDIEGTYNLSMRHYKKALKAYSDLMRLWADESWRIPDQPDLYLGHFNRFQVSVLYANDNLDELQLYARDLRKIPLLQSNLQLKFQRNSYQTDLMVRMNFGQFAAALKMSAEIEQWLDEHEKTLVLSAWMTFHFNLAVLHFLCEGFSKANQHIQKLLNLRDRTQRQDIRLTAALIQMVLQYELGNDSLVEHLHRRECRKRKKNEKEEGFQGLILDFFNPRKLQYGEAAIEDFRLLDETLRKLEEALQPGSSILGLNELRIWAESKVQSKKMSEILTERSQG